MYYLAGGMSLASIHPALQDDTHRYVIEGDSLSTQTLVVPVILHQIPKQNSIMSWQISNCVIFVTNEASFTFRHESNSRDIFFP